MNAVWRLLEENERNVRCIDVRGVRLTFTFQFRFFSSIDIALPAVRLVASEPVQFLFFHYNGHLSDFEFCVCDIGGSYVSIRVFL